MKTKMMVILLSTALSVGAAGKEQSESWSEGGVLKMTLELIALPDNDLQKAKIKLSVTNTGTNDIILDSTLVAGFSLRFKTDLSEELTHSGEKDVSRKEINKLEKPAAEAVRSRFLAVKPGQSLSRTLDFSGLVRDVVEGHDTDMNKIHNGFYYEAMQNYQVPAKAKKLEVTTWYERGVWRMATAQFEEWYGQSAKTMGLWSGRARSNTLVVEKK